EREFAVPDPRCQTLGKPCRGILAIGRHQLGKGGKQAGLGEAVAVNPVMPGLSPGFRYVSDSRTLVLVVPPRVRCRSCLNSHGLYANGCTPRAACNTYVIMVYRGSDYQF